MKTTTVASSTFFGAIVALTGALPAATLDLYNNDGAALSSSAAMTRAQRFTPTSAWPAPLAAADCFNQAGFHVSLGAGETWTFNLKLWRWQNDYATTVGNPDNLIASSTGISYSGPQDRWEMLAFPPQTANASYLLELTTTAHTYVAIGWGVYREMLDTAHPHPAGYGNPDQQAYQFKPSDGGFLPKADRQFDVRLVTATPPVPSSASASPAAICAGGSTTLSAVVGVGETADWYVDGCGGTFVGSGTLLSVSPAGTTTYYARARNTAAGCVSLACAAVTVMVQPCVPADFNRDTDVDLEDFAAFQRCFGGPNRPAAAGCSVDADLDGDSDVDLSDFTRFQACFNGPNRPSPCQAAPPCPPPAAPTNGSGSADTAGQITWSWVPAAGTGNVYRVYDAAMGGNLKATSAVDAASVSESGLSANTQYTRWAATFKTCESVARLALPPTYTLANVPGAPAVNGATNTTLDVTVNENGNPAVTTFAIRCVQGEITRYVQANGALAASEVFQVKAAWGAGGKITVTGLAPGTTYAFSVRAKNGDGVATAYGTTASGVTTAGSGSGTLAGKVKTATMQPIGGATVTANPGGYTATTDAGGSYTLSNVPVGTYNLTASRTGYQSHTWYGLVVTGGQTTNVPDNLLPRSCSKIGAHVVIGARTGWGDFLTQTRDCGKSCQLVKCVDDFGAANTAKAISPETLTIGRKNDTPNYDLQGFDSYADPASPRYTPPAQFAQIIFNELHPYWDQNPWIDVWEICNEWSWWWAYQADFYIAMMDICEAQTPPHRIALYGCSTGNPPEAFWPDIARACARAKAHGGHMLSLHEYPLDGLLCDKIRTHDDSLVLRYRRLYNYLRSNNADCPLALTEVCNGAGGSFIGIEPFVADMGCYDDQVRMDDYVFGIASWTLGNWEGANWYTALPAMADYICTH